MARHYRVTPEDVRASLAQQGGEDGIANSLRTRKAVEALMKNAKITDGEWIDESQAQVEEEAEKSKKAKKETKKETKETGETKEKKSKAEKKIVENKKAGDKELKKKSAKETK